LHRFSKKIPTAIWLTIFTSYLAQSPKNIANDSNTARLKKLPARRRVLEMVGDTSNSEKVHFELKRSLVNNFGTYRGSPALFFASAIRQSSLDVNHGDPRVRRRSRN
jgi:hypothetical protein